MTYTITLESDDGCGVKFSYDTEPEAVQAMDDLTELLHRKGWHGVFVELFRRMPGGVTTIEIRDR